MRKKIREKDGGVRVVSINRRWACRFMCVECLGWEEEAVIKCKESTCPLYPFRKQRGEQDSVKRSRAIRQFCIECCAEDQSIVSRCSAMLCPLHPYRQSSIDNTTLF